MQVVAEHLEEQAKLRLGENDEADHFARSAFNRFYYGAFLAIRDQLVQIDPKWQSGLSHKDIPYLLKGQIKKKILAEKKKAEELNDNDALSKCSSLLTLNKELANFMHNAYVVRLTADYNPDDKVVFSKQDFLLSGTSIKEARNWLVVANRWSILAEEMIQ